MAELKAPQTSDFIPQTSMSDSLTVTDNRTGKKYELPIQDGTIRAMDLRQIKAGPDDFGLMTYDPAFMNTANCRSAITYIDGDKGILLYRGYPIEELAEHSDYLETAYLILFGELPTSSQLQAWTREITLHTMLHENVKTFMEGFQYDAHPMGIFLSTVGALSTVNPRREVHLRQGVAAAPDAAADRQGAEHRRLRLPPQHRPAVHLPRQRSELHRQLPEHAVQHAGREVPPQPGAGARARRAVHPARRSRTELQHERRCATSAARTSIRTRRWPARRRRCTGRCTAARTKPCCGC